VTNTRLVDEIENVTLGHYGSNADSFWAGTREHDVSQNIRALLNALPKDKVLDILDLGCGPGRDLLTFKNLGHRPTGLDGCEEFCKMAREYSGCSVLCQRFSHLQLVKDSFDGIFANASLFHVPSYQLPSVLATCQRCLRPGGVLFTSNPRGDAEGWQGSRYGNFMEFEKSKSVLQQAGFTIIDHYYRPEGQPRNRQPWLAIVSQCDQPDDSTFY
jgi:SAM-dependent methyltransferase